MGRGDVVLRLLRDRHHGSELERIADDDDSSGPPDRADGVLRRCLPGLVDEEPAESLRSDPTEHSPA